MRITVELTTSAEIDIGDSGILRHSTPLLSRLDGDQY
jgi:hypothetical protein